MPTLTLSWTDIALFALTAGVIGGVALAGSQIRSGSSLTDPSTNKNKSRTSKRKKIRSKKSGVNETNSSPIVTPPTSLSPSLEEKIPEEKKAQTVCPTRSAPSKKANQPKLDEKEFPPLIPSIVEKPSQSKSAAPNAQSTATRPYAERMQAPVRKTKVDDMIDEDVEPPVKLARVMKIVEESSSSSLTESDAEDGWEKVSDGKKSRGGAKTMSLKMSTTPNPVAPPGSASGTASASKRQRQNAKKKEAAKAAKAAEEAERLGRLSAHQRQQEQIRMNQQASNRASTSSKSKEVGGGMKASIGEDGRLIWE